MGRTTSPWFSVARLPENAGSTTRPALDDVLRPNRNPENVKAPGDLSTAFNLLRGAVESNNPGRILMRLEQFNGFLEHHVKGRPPGGSTERLVDLLLDVSHTTKSGPALAPVIHEAAAEAFNFVLLRTKNPRILDDILVRVRPEVARWKEGSPYNPKIGTLWETLQNPHSRPMLPSTPSVRRIKTETPQEHRAMAQISPPLVPPQAAAALPAPPAPIPVAEAVTPAPLPEPIPVPVKVAPTRPAVRPVLSPEKRELIGARNSVKPAAWQPMIEATPKIMTLWQQLNQQHDDLPLRRTLGDITRLSSNEKLRLENIDQDLQPLVLTGIYELGNTVMDVLEEALPHAQQRPQAWAVQCAAAAMNSLINYCPVSPSSYLGQRFSPALVNQLNSASMALRKSLPEISRPATGLLADRLEQQAAHRALGSMMEEAENGRKRAAHRGEFAWTQRPGGGFIY